MIIPSRPHRRWMIGTGAVTVACALLAGAAGLGVVLRSFDSMSALPHTASLDYRRGPVDGFAPLRPEFVRSVLGGRVVALPTTAERGAPTLISPRRGTVGSGRIIEAHALTNDDIASAKEIPGVPFTARTDTRTATREPGEPSDCARAGSSVWYRYTTPDSQALTADTFGTGHAIALAVFIGRPGQLRQVACDTDVAGSAQVAFVASEHETYFFQVTAPLGGGELVFNVDPHGSSTLASRSSSGERGNGGNSRALSVSGDGRYIAFASTATNLAPGIDSRSCVTRDPALGYVTDGACPQIYVHDRLRGTTELISKTRTGEAGNSGSWNPFVSSDGRYVVYETAASNLDPDDVDGGFDLFVHDRTTGITEKIPAASTSRVSYVLENYDGFFFGSISDDGRYVAFDSPAPDLVEGDTNSDRDAFVYDRHLRATERVSVSSSGGQMTGRIRNGGLYPSMSADGRYVTFMSDSPSLAPGDTNGVDDFFVRDRLTRTTERVSVSTTGAEGNGAVWEPGYQTRRISTNGRYVVFSSRASNLVPDDTNADSDLFVRDRVAGTTVRVSVSSTGAQAVGSTDPAATYNPFYYSISADGQYVAFDTSAVGLTPSDTTKDWDVFVHDLTTRTTTLVTLSPSGGDTTGQGASISGDGRAVAYLSGQIGDRTGGGFQMGTNDVLVFEAPRPR